MHCKVELLSASLNKFKTHWGRCEHRSECLLPNHSILRPSKHSKKQLQDGDYDFKLDIVPREASCPPGGRNNSQDISVPIEHAMSCPPANSWIPRSCIANLHARFTTEKVELRTVSSQLILRTHTGVTSNVPAKLEPVSWLYLNLV
eukprot:2644651-Amphidinium_carterae.1